MPATAESSTPMKSSVAARRSNLRSVIGFLIFVLPGAGSQHAQFDSSAWTYRPANAETYTDEGMGPLLAAAHPDDVTLPHHPRLRRASGAHRIDGVGKLLALALHALPAGNLTFAGDIERSVDNLDLTLSLVMADDHALWRDAGSSQLERMRRRAVGEELFAAAKHDRHCEDAHGVDQVTGEQRVDEFGTALGDEVRAVFLLQALHVGDVAQKH